jgi:hypothetical protein
VFLSPLSSRTNAQVNSPQIPYLTRVAPYRGKQYPPDPKAA